MKLTAENIGERFMVPTDDGLKKAVLADVSDSAFYFRTYDFQASIVLRILDGVTFAEETDVERNLMNLIDALRDDFQKLEQLFHATLETIQGTNDDLEEEGEEETPAESIERHE